MLFTRIASCLTFVLALGILAVAKPVELESRANLASVENVITTLKSKTDVIIPQIKSAAGNKQASAATFQPLINELVSALNSAHSSVTKAQLGELKKRQTDSDIAGSLAGVISEITGAVALIPIGLPGFLGILIPLDVAISGLLTGLDVAVVGLGLAVGGLLGSVGGLLASLGLGLTLGLLGL